MKHIIGVQKVIFCLLCFGCFSLGASAQKQVIRFAHDASGNVVGRTVEAVTGNTDLSVGGSVHETVLPTGEGSVKIYPNPTSGFFQVELAGYGDVLSEGTLSIYSMQGSLVARFNRLQQINSVDLTHLPGGTYLLHIVIDGKTLTYRVVKE